MKNRIVNPEIDNEVITIQKKHYQLSKNNLFLTGFICFILLSVMLITNSWLILSIFLISVLDLRIRNLEFRFQKAMLLSLASESLTHTVDSII